MNEIAIIFSEILDNFPKKDSLISHYRNNHNSQIQPNTDLYGVYQLLVETIKASEVLRTLFIEYINENQYIKLLEYYFSVVQEDILNIYLKRGNTFDIKKVIEVNLNHEINDLVVKKGEYNVYSNINCLNTGLSGKYTIRKGGDRIIKLLHDKEGIKNGTFIFDSISTIDFEITNSNRQKILYEYIEIKNIEIREAIKNFILNKLEIIELEIENITNNSEKLEFRDLYIHNLRIKNSNLGKMVFNGVEIGELTIENVTLNDCIFNGVKFPQGNKLKDIKKEDGTTDFKKMKDNYRQLKFIMDKNNNYTEANKFFSHEMYYHYKTLNWRKDFIEKIILILQDAISYYGNDWLTPLFWIFFISNFGVLYISFFYFGGLEIPSFREYLIKLYYIRDYLNLLVHNITPFSEIIRGESTTWVKFLYNLVILFLIYHFGVALKRTTKR